MTEEQGGRSPTGRAGGPSDLSPCGSQPKALIPSAVMCEPMHPDGEGWSEWVHPAPNEGRGFLMQCCDCGLIHEMQFNIAEPMPGMVYAELNPGEGVDGVVIFRARRWPTDTSALQRMVALDEELGLYNDAEAVPLSPTAQGMRP